MKYEPKELQKLIYRDDCLSFCKTREEAIRKTLEYLGMLKEKK